MDFLVNNSLTSTYCVNDHGVVLMTLDILKGFEGVKCNLMILGMSDIYLVKSNKDVSDWDTRKKFGQTLHENLKYFLN